MKYIQKFFFLLIIGCTISLDGMLENSELIHSYIAVDKNAYNKWGEKLLPYLIGFGFRIINDCSVKTSQEYEKYCWETYLHTVDFYVNMPKEQRFLYAQRYQVVRELQACTQCQYVYFYPYTIGVHTFVKKYIIVIDEQHRLAIDSLLQQMNIDSCKYDYMLLAVASGLFQIISECVFPYVIDSKSGSCNNQKLIDCLDELFSKTLGYQMTREQFIAKQFKNLEIVSYPVPSASQSRCIVS